VKLNEVNLKSEIRNFPIGPARHLAQQSNSKFRISDLRFTLSNFEISSSRGGARNDAKTEKA
jgi:hypothetical protein